jgi:hypothetical protein
MVGAAPLGGLCLTLLFASAVKRAVLGGVLLLRCARFLLAKAVQIHHRRHGLLSVLWRGETSIAHRVRQLATSGAVEDEKPDGAR